MTELTRSQSNAKAGGKGQACERLWEARPWIERSRGRPESKDAAWTHFWKKCFNLWKLTRTGSLSAHSAKGGREEERVFLSLEEGKGRPRSDSYLVDSASSHMLVSKIKPCMSKYKQLCTVKLRMAH